MRKLIINFAIAAVMTGLFTAMVGAQVGMAMSAARGGSDKPEGAAMSFPPGAPADFNPRRWAALVVTLAATSMDLITEPYQCVIECSGHADAMEAGRQAYKG